MTRRCVESQHDFGYIATYFRAACMYDNVIRKRVFCLVIGTSLQCFLWVVCYRPAKLTGNKLMAMRSEYHARSLEIEGSAYGHLRIPMDTYGNGGCHRAFAEMSGGGVDFTSTGCSRTLQMMNC